MRIGEDEGETTDAMPTDVLFYVSGHGFGHARRMTQVIRALLEKQPNLSIHIRSGAPARVFEPIPARAIQTSAIDAGMIEADTLTIDRAKTLSHLKAFFKSREMIVADEVRMAGELQPRLIVADIPFLAGDVAQALGIPCIGVSNFTWDWIYGTLFSGAEGYEPIHRQIVKSYGKFSEILQLPFGETCQSIPKTTPVPLIAPKSSRERAQVLAQLGIDGDDPRRRILFGMRGQQSIPALCQAASVLPMFHFLCVQPLPSDALTNIQVVRLSEGLDFSDVLRVCDVVVSKLGYGIVSECIAARVRLVWPRRAGFVEDAITEAELPRYVPTVEISHDDYASGRWGPYLQKVLAQAMPVNQIRTDGAEVCADWILAAS